MRWRLDAGQIEVVDDAVAAVLRGKTVAQRVAMTLSSHRTARLLMGGSIRSCHPEWTEEQIQCEVSRRMLLGTK
jgi:hypothetical protein